MRLRALMTTILVVTAMTACQKDQPEISQYRDIVVTSDLSIGRVLFYDKNISVNNTISCASCHKQEFAFADNVSLSKGFDNQLTLRNSIAIQNINGSSNFPFLPPSAANFLFWDGRENNITEMMLQPIVNHREMGILDLDALCKRLEGLDYYQELFLRDYGRTTISPMDIATELEGFVVSIRTNSKFDRSVNLSQPLSTIEQQGRTLFFEKYDCSACHQEQNPGGGYHGSTDPVAALGFANIGLDVVEKDKGLGAVSGRPEDNGKFRIPPLRNVALTAPYMHDGRFKTLDEVMGHYSHGIANHKNLDHRLKNDNGNPEVFNISDSEKHALIAFLNTMTDFEMTTREDLSDPFIIRDL